MATTMKSMFNLTNFDKNRINRFDFSTNEKGRCLTVLAIFIVLFFTCGTYGGWFFYIDIFERNQVYHWLCDNPSDSEICPTQKAAIQLLFSFCQSSHYFMHIVAAFLKDLIGVKRVCMMGCFMFSIGMFLLAISSESFRAFIPAFILIGASNDFTYYASLSLISIFPKRANMITGLCLGGTIFSSWVPGILNIVEKTFSISFRNAALIYLFCFAIPSFLILISLVPWFKFKYAMQLEDEKKISVNVTQNYSSKNSVKEQKVPSLKCKNAEDTSEHSYENDTVHPPHSISYELNDGNSTLNGSHHSSPFSSPPSSPNQAPSNLQDHSRVSLDSVIPASKNHQHQQSEITSKPENFNKIYQSTLMGAIVSPHYLMFLVYWFVNIIRYIFFQNSSREIYGMNLTLMIGYLNPTTAPALCIFYGMLIDKFGFYNGAMIMNIPNAILHSAFAASTVTSSILLDWSGFIWPLTIGNFVIMLAFTRIHFSHVPYFSILNGIGFIIAGLSSYISSGLFSISVILLNGNFLYVTATFATLSILGFPYLLLIKHVAKRNKLQRERNGLQNIISKTSF